MQQSAAILNLCLRKTLAGKSHVYCDAIILENLALFSNYFPSTRKRKANIFKFLRFEERCRKAPFL